MSTVRYTTIQGEVIAEKRSGVRSQYVPDALGSTVALLNSSNNQTPTDTFSYYPYGTVASRTGTMPTPYQFVGTAGYYADASGKTYVRARYLDSAKGRWLTVDKFADIGESEYLYAFSNPITYYDPDGNRPQSPARQPQAKCSQVLHEAKKLIGTKCGNDDLRKGMACIDVWETSEVNAHGGFEKSPQHSIIKACKSLKRSGHWQDKCKTGTIEGGCLITFFIKGEPDQGCGAHSAVVVDSKHVIMCSSTCPGATKEQPIICLRAIDEWISIQPVPPGGAGVKGCGCFCKKGR